MAEEKVPERDALIALIREREAEIAKGPMSRAEEFAFLHDPDDANRKAFDATCAKIRTGLKRLGIEEGDLDLD